MIRRFTGWFKRSIAEHRLAFRVFLIFAVLALIFLSIVLYTVSVDYNSKVQNKRHLAAIEEAREELPDSAKTPLDSDFVEKEYNTFLRPRNRLVFLAFLALFSFLALMTIPCFYASISGIRLLMSKNREHSYLGKYFVGRFFLPPIWLFLVGMSIYFMIDPCKKVGFAKRTFEVQELNVIKKETEAKQVTNLDGKTSTYGDYFLQCEKDGEQYAKKVKFEIYDQVQERGTYFLVYVHYDDLEDLVGIYSAEEYEYPAFA